MASNQWVFVLVAMCAVTMALAVEDEPKNRPWFKAPIGYESDEESQDDNLALASQQSANWVSCNFNDHVSFSCQDCNTKIICLPHGGLLRPCKNPRRPHCNNGFCSATPSANCPASVV